MIFRATFNKLLSPVFLVLMIFGGLEAIAKEIDWKKCQQPTFGNTTVPFDKDYKFVPDCAPEVLYSWRHPEKMKAYSADTKSGIVEKNGRALFTFKTPAGSHGYGNESVRIKLRKDVKFVFANAQCEDKDKDKKKEKYMYNYWEYCDQRDCNYYQKKYPDQYDKIVVVAYLSFLEGFSEYILCSDGPIESWSVGTPEHLKEIQNEYKYWQKNKSTEEHDAVNRVDGMIREKKLCTDGKYCSEKDLQESIMRHHKLAETGGKIFYSPGVAEDREAHFNTDKKFYYSIPNTDVSKNPERVNEDLYGGAK